MLKPKLLIQGDGGRVAVIDLQEAVRRTLRPAPLEQIAHEQARESAAPRLWCGVHRKDANVRAHATRHAHGHNSAIRIDDRAHALRADKARLPREFMRRRSPIEFFPNAELRNTMGERAINQLKTAGDCGRGRRNKRRAHYPRATARLVARRRKVGENRLRDDVHIQPKYGRLGLRGIPSLYIRETRDSLIGSDASIEQAGAIGARDVIG